MSVDEKIVPRPLRKSSRDIVSSRGPKLQIGENQVNHGLDEQTKIITRSQTNKT